MIGGDSRQTLDVALANAVVWAGRRTLCALDPWPWPHSVAALLACDVEDSPRNAAFTARGLVRARARGTFFCVTDFIKGDSNLARQMKLSGELAVHGNTHEPFDEPSVTTQYLCLQSARWTLWRLGGKWAAGLHPPEETFNLQTYRAMAGARLRYLVTGAESESSLPTIVRVSQTALWSARHHNIVRLNRTAEDDLAFSPLGISGLEPEWIIKRVLADFEVLRGLKGLYILSFHTQGLSAPEYADVFPRLIEHLQADQTWIATANELADWWLNRSQISLRVSAESESSVLLSVFSQAPRPVEGLAISLYPAIPSSRVRADAVGAQSPPVEVVPKPSESCVKLLLKRIEPGRAYNYHITLNP